MRKDEKLTYENERGEKIEFSLFSSYHPLNIDGIASLVNYINTSKGVNQDGITIKKSNLESRNIIITAAIKENKESNRRRLVTVLNPKLSGRLIYESSSEKKFINCFIEKSPEPTKERIPKFQLSLLCPVPYWQAYFNEGAEISTWIGGWKFKFKLPFRFKQKGEPKKNVYNEGHVETPIEIIFRGPALNPRIVNHATGEFIKINRELTSDDTLYITTEYGNKKVEIEKDGVKQNAFNYIDLDSTFFQLQVGDNMIEYTTENELQPQSVEIRYRNRYSGV